MGFMASVLASTVASTWFVEKRGLVTGLLMGATTAGQLVFMQVHRALVDSQGWRCASIAIGCLTIGRDQHPRAVTSAAPRGSRVVA